MENNNNILKRTVLILDAILIVLGLITSVISIPKTPFIINLIFFISLYALIAVYAFIGYKKPHGNLLKAVMLIYDFMLITQMLTAAEYKNIEQIIIFSLVMMMIAYIAGRLNRIDQNKILIPVVAILLGYLYIKILMNGVYPLYVYPIIITPFVIWFVLGCAYFVRYKEHKEAGLMDAPKSCK